MQLQKKINRDHKPEMNYLLVFSDPETKYAVPKYRVSTKELYTFKMIQKTNAAYLELHTYISR
jgi:hypothetical protein